MVENRFPTDISRRRFLSLTPAVLLPLVLPACGSDEENGLGRTPAYTYEPVARLYESELVTVSDTEAVFTWVTDVRGDTHVLLTREGAERHLDLSGPPTRYHYARVRGLEPGTEYTYQLVSGERAARSTVRSPGRFRTLETPPGELLFTFATVNDTHVGEETAGLICFDGTCLNEGFQTPWPDLPYWSFTNEATVRAINARGPDFVIHKGDVSSEFREEEFRTARRIYSGLRMPCHFLRGNHDRVGDREADFFREVFGLETTHRHFIHREHLFVLLDSCNLDTGLPQIDDAQFRWLEEVFASHPGRRTLVFLHHAVTRDAQLFSLPADDRDRLVDLLAAHGGVIGVFSGHSHRAKVTRDGRTGGLPYAETPATKEYPGGFCLYRVYSGGYIQTFYRTPGTYCLPWYEITKGEYLGFAPAILFGELDDRCFAHRL